MSFALLYNTSVTVKRPTSVDINNDPVLGSAQTFKVRRRAGGRYVGQGKDRIDVITTAEFQFQQDDRVWFEGDTEASLPLGRKVLAAGTDTSAGYTLYWAEL